MLQVISRQLLEELAGLFKSHLQALFFRAPAFALEAFDLAALTFLASFL